MCYTSVQISDVMSSENLSGMKQQKKHRFLGAITKAISFRAQLRLRENPSFCVLRLKTVDRQNFKCVTI